MTLLFSVALVSTLLLIAAIKAMQKSNKVHRSTEGGTWLERAKANTFDPRRIALAFSGLLLTLVVWTTIGFNETGTSILALGITLIALGLARTNR